MKNYRFYALLFVLLFSVIAIKAAVKNEIVVNPANTCQTIKGWGVSLCWWAREVGSWDEESIDELIDWLVSPDGLNYNYFRYNIGGGDGDFDGSTHTIHHMGLPGGKGVRAEMEGFQDKYNGDFIWSRDSAQRRIMLKIREKRPDAHFEAFSNSAPWWMTYSGCCAGNYKSTDDNLKPEYYEAFAKYLVTVCKYYKDVYGLEFNTLSPFNEPNSSWWYFNGGQEGCHFSAPAEAEFLKVLRPVLKASGLKTKITASEDWSIKSTLSSLKTLEDSSALALIDQVNTHSYDGNMSDRVNLRNYCKRKDIPLVMSETGNGGEGMDGQLALSEIMFNDLHYMQPTVWCDWQYMGGDIHWCLVTMTGKNDKGINTYKQNKNFYFHRQVTHFIKSGYTMLAMPDDKVVAAISPKRDTLVCVFLNRTYSDVTYKVDLGGFSKVGGVKCFFTDRESDNMENDSMVSLKGKKMTFDARPNSVSTAVIKVQL